jgi:hypothetical protein
MLALAAPAAAGVPRALADGSSPAPLPQGLQTFHGKPVLGARALAPGTPAVRDCPADASLRGRTRVIGAWVSAEGLSVGYAVHGTPPLFACDATRVGGRWQRCARASSPTRDPERLVRAGGSVGLCGARAFMWIAPPVQSRWVLVEHASYWTAYPSPATRLLRVSGTKDGSAFRVHVAFLTGDARLIAEKTIKGFVAG